ncbi:MAG: DUF6069 family protein [Ornithinimicrobium sp.]
MSIDTNSQTAKAQSEQGPTTGSLIAVTIRAAIVALVANILVYTIAAAAGVAFTLTPPGASAIEVQPASVITMTIGPVVIGGVVLVLLGRLSPAWATRFMPWIGLFIGIGTAAMPISMDGDLTARLLLAAMHVITGVAWFISVRRIKS